MSRTKRPRKAYRPRTVQADPVSWAVAGVHTLPTQSQRDVLAVAETGFDKLRQGVAAREDWNLVCQALNTAEALCDLHIGDNLKLAILDGQGALLAIGKRMMKNGRTACYAGELAAIREAIDLHAVQLKLCTQAEYSRALKKVKNLINGGAADDVARMFQQMEAA